MRRNLCLILTGLLFLAACNSSGTPLPPTIDMSGATAENVQATPPPAGVTDDSPATLPPAPTIDQQERAFGTDEPPLPLPGTLVAPSEPDQEAGLVFDNVLFERTGGLAGIPLMIEIKGDGTFTRDGVPGTLSADQVTQIDNAIDALDFFGLQGVFTAPGTSTDVFSYRITVDRAGSSRTIPAQDGFLPPELMQFITLLSDVGAPTR